MRIAQMLDSLNWGGAQKMQHFLVESLHPLGIEITVISLRASSNSTIISDLESAGAQVISFPFPQLYSPGSFFKLVQFLRKEKFALLHTYLTYSNIIGSAAGALTGTPVITSLRNADFDYKNYSSQREYLERISMRHLAQRTMANGNMVGEFARKRLGDKAIVDVIPNAVDFLPPITPEERLALRQEAMGDPQRVMILSVGRLTEQKGFVDLIEAFARIHPEYPNSALVIAGGGDLKASLQNKIAELQLQNDVFLLGIRNDARQLMASADIYVNSSHWEGTPVSVLEAMAAGLPIVATRVGENPYLLAENTGLLVNAQQPQQLAEALGQMLCSAETRQKFASAALARINSHYSRAVWRKSLLDLYAQVTPQAKPYLDQLMHASGQPA